VLGFLAKRQRHISSFVSLLILSSCSSTFRSVGSRRPDSADRGREEK